MEKVQLSKRREFADKEIKIKKEVLPRLELGSQDSKSWVLTITP